MNAIESVIDQFLLTWKLLFDKRVPITTKLVPIAAVLYLFSPIDFIPDFFFGIGQLDDIGLMIAAIKAFELMSPADVVAELREELRSRRAEDAAGVVDAPAWKEKHKNG
ncbi:MAG: DUF1232 domain-containing protein [Anaerolineae bacterium]|nr:DUF1232 domain-containing protein [Anaerolineae bacterium]